MDQGLMEGVKKVRAQFVTQACGVRFGSFPDIALEGAQLAFGRVVVRQCEPWRDPRYQSAEALEVSDFHIAAVPIRAQLGFENSLQLPL